MPRPLETSPDVSKGLLAPFVEQAKKLREEKADNLMLAMETLLSGFLEGRKETLNGSAQHRGASRRRMEGLSTDGQAQRAERRARLALKTVRKLCIFLTGESQCSA